MAFYHGMETTAWPTIATEKVRSTHLLACGQSLCSMQVQQHGKRVKAEGCGSGGADLSMKHVVACLAIVPLGHSPGRGSRGSDGLGFGTA